MGTAAGPSPSQLPCPGGPPLRSFLWPRPALCGSATCVLLLGAACTPGRGVGRVVSRVPGLSSLVLVALGAGTQAFTQRRGTGQAEQHSRTAASRPCRSSHLGGFSAPEVECLGLRDGTAAWQLCPLLALCAVAAEHVFGEPGASLRLWEGLSLQSWISLWSGTVSSDCVVGTALSGGSWHSKTT